MPPVQFILVWARKTIIDELTVIWPDRKQQVIKKIISADQTLKLDYTDAVAAKKQETKKVSFKDITNQSGITFIHHEDNYNDFEYEALLPYKNSQMGPGLAAGDINGDGLEDFFVGNGKGFPGAMYLQTDKGTFREIPGPWIADSIYEDTGALLFDADNDGRMDLYVVSGGNDHTKDSRLSTRTGYI